MLEHLAGRIVRQAIEEADFLRHLVAGELGSAVIHHGALVEIGARLQHDERPSDFAPFLVRHADDRILQHAVELGTMHLDSDKGGVWNVVEQTAPERFNQQLARNPLGRQGTPQEIASAAVFLASPVSSFTTGSNLVVDGAISNRVNF